MVETETSRSDWRPVRLGELVTIEHGWPFKSELMTETLSGGPIVVSIGNMDYTGGFRFESTRLREYLGSYPSAYNLQPGDLLLAMTCQTAGGEILGIPGRIPNDKRIYLHNQRLGKVHIKVPNAVCLEYLYWLFRYDKFNEHLRATASGTKILHTSPSRIEAYEFSLPSLPEQRAIAFILGALDDKIELNRRMNATLEAMARAIFQSWFVDFDPVRAKAEGRETGLPVEIAALFPDGFVESELGEIPEGWEVLGLDSIAEFLNGLALQKYPPTDTQILPVIKIAQLRDGHTIGADSATATIPQQYVVSDGDVLFSWSGSLECVLWAGGTGALNQHLFKVTSDTYPKWFYYLWIHEHLSEFRHIAAGKATTMGHIQRHHLTDARVVIPSPRVLEAANGLIDSLLEHSWRRRVESRNLAVTRDALLPKLVSSELRVTNKVWHTP